MPFQYRPWYYRRYNKRWRRRRRRFNTRRSRKTFRRNRRSWVRKRRYFRFRKRKLKKIRLNQWQPQLIRKCKITGLFTLFQSTFERGSNNYAQYQLSYVPEKESGGGGWGIFVFNLGAFYQMFERVRNWWTYSNINLPLCRYLGCKFTFYRDDFIDYIVTYTTNFPMTDSDLKHAEAQPYRMMLRKRKIVVTCKHKNRHRKPYKKVRIHPPRQLTNRWFFQREFTNTNLLLLTATAASLTTISCPPNEPSNNISFYTINPRLFQNLNFNNYSQTTGYNPQIGRYLYGTKHVEITSPTTLPKNGDLIVLGNTNKMQAGKSLNECSTNTDWGKSDNWGNPFFTSYLTGDYLIWVSTQQYTFYINSGKNDTATNLTLLSEPPVLKCRYSPDVDTGYETQCYLKSNFNNNNYKWDPPENEQLRFVGFPLWNLFWGWLDWQRKLALVSQIDKHYTVIFKSPHVRPKLEYYMPIDTAFIENHHPFDTQEQPDPDDKLSWHPKVLFQQQTINQICMTGPCTVQPISKTFQAHCKYDFFFKWGGSPSEMETIADPSKQQQYPVPNTVTSGLQIQDPTFDPRQYIYTWDTRRDLLTTKATERISKDYGTEQSMLFPTDNQFNPPAPRKDISQTLQTLIQTQTTEKDQETIQNLIQQFQLKQQQLRLNLQQLLNQRLNI
nr:MAG: ORF1 [TTV-like mini virus]